MKKKINHVSFSIRLSRFEMYIYMYNEFEWMVVCKEVRSIASNMSLLSIKVRKRRIRKEKGYLILYHYRLMLFTRLPSHSAY